MHSSSGRPGGINDSPLEDESGVCLLLLPSSVRTDASWHSVNTELALGMFLYLGAKRSLNMRFNE